MSSQNIELIIDEIVVHGAPGMDRDYFRAQVEQELSRLLQEEGGLPGPTAVRAGVSEQTVTVAPGQTPNATQVARALHGALKG